MEAPIEGITLRPPTSTDGASVHRLIASCPPLDTNSMYCNLLQCLHFSTTSVAAERDGELVGFISGYIPPEQPDTLFIWQVAVGDAARGCGLATKMLNHIVERTACADVKWMETTITPDNQASWKLFEGFARKHDTELTKRVLFDEQEHFQGAHASEWLAKIGPL